MRRDVVDVPGMIEVKMGRKLPRYRIATPREAAVKSPSFICNMFDVVEGILSSKFSIGLPKKVEACEQRLPLGLDRQKVNHCRLTGIKVAPAASPRPFLPLLQSASGSRDPCLPSIPYLGCDLDLTSFFPYSLIKARESRSALHPRPPAMRV